MSTRGTIAIARTTEVVGDETYGQSLHFYEECFDDERNVYCELFQQGVFSNVTHGADLTREEGLKLFEELGKWAAEQREWDAKAEKEK